MDRLPVAHARVDRRQGGGLPLPHDLREKTRPRPRILVDDRVTPPSVEPDRGGTHQHLRRVLHCRDRGCERSRAQDAAVPDAPPLAGRPQHQDRLTREMDDRVEIAERLRPVHDPRETNDAYVVAIVRLA